ncbi:MAG: hypothetical protein PHO02_03585 [Candidatus Nanoarchaeia archaeon]|nr:hypothetical protein [Candidatus Nanoarchaeia archaeon]
MGLKMPSWAEFNGANQAEYFARGQRSFVYRLKYKGKEAAAKVERADRDAICRASNEAKWLKLLNKKKIGPKLLLEGSDFILVEFVEGKRILEFAETAEKEELSKALLDVMMQCRALDKINVSKEEMHNPWKHIIVGKKPAISPGSKPPFSSVKKAVMIDFERCHYDIHPKNVTQFCQFLMSKKQYALLETKGIKFEKEKAIALLKQYKTGRDVFEELLKSVSLKP